MDPVTLSFAVTIAQLIIKDAIPLARKLVEIVHKPDPTLADWNALLDDAEGSAKATLAKLAAEGITPTSIP